MNGDGVEVEGGHEGRITIWAMAEKRPGKLTPKQLGEIAEAEFVAKAVGMGFVVAKPWGDSEPYDFIVNPKKSFIFWRVQVKSAHVIGRMEGAAFGLMIICSGLIARRILMRWWLMLGRRRPGMCFQCGWWRA